MKWQKGNEYWKQRSSHGRNAKFSDPDILLSACEEYFEWVTENPLYEVELVKFQGSATEHKVPKMRAMTILGLCVFLDISHDTWRNYRENSDLIGVITHVEAIIKTQKFEGAAAELLNPNIIARDLGLSDKTENELSTVDEDGEKVGVSGMIAFAPKND